MYFKPRCSKPFVQIGENCYFFSTNKAPSYEYYKLSYKGITFSVPTTLDWLHAGFGCETLDAEARVVSVESLHEMRAISDYMRHQAHAETKPAFWSGGHRGRMLHMSIDKHTLNDFYWHHAQLPMNYSNWATGEPQDKAFPEGFCVYLEFTGSELVMGTMHCDKKMAYVCEIQHQ
ncbi:uncharacterized protein LOC115626234 [Scaptodrosophila lebanonensis]|uniref:Uncharacterized protein LOC115626234 n=1 Tax=Drosophila lebanonensis TaxID=7225 RepID=A0A6J2TR24_DROLE|nr:uncharacterized protein LOC115626234 [Scaptodrosophila lebanonensis]